MEGAAGDDHRGARWARRPERSACRYSDVQRHGDGAADYATKSGTLNFAQGVRSQTFTVTTVNTPAADGERTVTLSSRRADRAAPPLGTERHGDADHQDNDAPGTFQFGAATYSVVEAGHHP